jgi:hypothetical protein
MRPAELAHVEEMQMAAPAIEFLCEDLCEMRLADAGRAGKAEQATGLSSRRAAMCRRNCCAMALMASSWPTTRALMRAARSSASIVTRLWLRFS